jgi:ABC-type branched-subunit amino acid transport system substrate-binding protein
MPAWSWTAVLAGAVLSSSQSESRGKQIYVRGTSASGREITASLGDPAAGLPGSSLACAGCHGLDGLGKPEGGIVPPNVTWGSLTKSYGHRHPDGREHPAYTEQSLRRAITMGIDPAGNRLGVAMPKYAMSAQDATDLVAYLKRLGKEKDRGLTDRAIRIGAIVAGEGPLSEAGREIQALLEAYFDEVNAQAGIHDRRVEIRFLRDPGGPLSARLARFVEKQGAFALLEARALGDDQELAERAEAEEIPVVVPLAAFPEADAGAHRHVFYLLAGLKDQGRALVEFAARKLDLEKPRVAIVHPQSGSFPEVVRAMKEQCGRSGCSSTIEVGYPSGAFLAASAAAALKQDASQVVCFLGSGKELKGLMEETQGSSPAPTFLIPGALAGSDVFDAPAASGSKVFVAYPMLPSDQTPEGLQELRALARKKRLSLHHLPLQVAAYGAARVLVEGLRRAGRDLSREKLLTELEGLYEFETGLLPPMTFGPNLRIGAPGAYVVAVDRARRRFVPVSGWIAPK